MTTLTKAKFFEATKLRTELVKDVPGFGDVYLKDVGEVQRSRRVAALFDNNGNRIKKAAELRRIHEIVDQVCSDDKGSPMFTDEDIPQLAECASSRLDPLYMALAMFNEGSQKKDSDESSD